MSYKVLLVGSEGVGKYSFLQKLYNSCTMTKFKDNILNIEYISHKVQGLLYTAVVLNPKYKHINLGKGALSTKERNARLVVQGVYLGVVFFDVGNLASFQDVEQGWLRVLRGVEGVKFVALVGYKIDKNMAVPLIDILRFVYKENLGLFFARSEMNCLEIFYEIILWKEAQKYAHNLKTNLNSPMLNKNKSYSVREYSKYLRLKMLNGMANRKKNLAHYCIEEKKKIQKKLQEISKAFPCKLAEDKNIEGDLEYTFEFMYKQIRKYKEDINNFKIQSDEISVKISEAEKFVQSITIYNQGLSSYIQELAKEKKSLYYTLGLVYKDVLSYNSISYIKIEIEYYEKTLFALKKQNYNLQSYKYTKKKELLQFSTIGVDEDTNNNPQNGYIDSVSSFESGNKYNINMEIYELSKQNYYLENKIIKMKYYLIMKSRLLKNKDIVFVRKIKRKIEYFSEMKIVLIQNKYLSNLQSGAPQKFMNYYNLLLFIQTEYVTLCLLNIKNIEKKKQRLFVFRNETSTNEYIYEIAESGKYPIYSFHYKFFALGKMEILVFPNQKGYQLKVYYRKNSAFLKNDKTLSECLHLPLERLKEGYPIKSIYICNIIFY